MTAFPVSRRINGERIVLAGWSRAIALQMAHPLIAAGVYEHSSFRQSPAVAVRRLRETVRAMLSLTFGTPAERQRTTAGIRAIHRRVHGHLRDDVGRFPAGTRYSAEDPDLVLWVHATVLESTVIAYEACIGPVSAADRDAYCQEAESVPISLGARPEEVPRHWQALEHYLAGVRASNLLAVGSDATLIVSALLNGSAARLSGPLGWANRLVTTGWLPADVRSMYGLPWRPSDDVRLARAVRFVRATRRVLPDVLALWPEARRTGRHAR